MSLALDGVVRHKVGNREWEGPRRPVPRVTETAPGPQEPRLLEGGVLDPMASPLKDGGGLFLVYSEAVHGLRSGRQHRDPTTSWRMPLPGARTGARVRPRVEPTSGPRSLPFRRP